MISCSGRSEEEAIERAAAKFGVSKDKISLKQGKDQRFLPRGLLHSETQRAIL